MNLLSGYQTVVDYSKEPREVLEAKARMLDCLELHVASMCHGCVDFDLNDFVDTFSGASFECYFSQNGGR